MRPFFCTLFIIFSGISINNVHAQDDAREKLDNLKYYLSSITDNIESMRYYADSTQVVMLLDKMSELSQKMDVELAKVNLPEVKETVVVEEEVIVNEPKIEDIEDYSKWPETNPEEQDDDRLGVSKYMPFKKKLNTNLTIQFGINSIQTGNSTPSGILSPEINTGGSWYWDFGLTRRARLGGKTSKVALNYGISYLKNRFKIENDLRLTDNNGNPEFVAVSDVKNNPKLNIGYINVPLSLSFALSKKTKLTVGGYAGYRISTVQKFCLKPQGETIEENRYAGYNLNNWMYGGTFGVDIAGFDIIARYNFSKLFKDNPNYDYNTFMIGTSVSLF